MTSTIEEAVEAARHDSNPSTALPKLTVGLPDLAGRLAQLEHQSLQHKQRITVLEAEVAACRSDMALYTKDREDGKARVEAAVKLPNENGKRIDDLEKRTRTLEGAVGSVGYQKAGKDDPATTDPAAPPAGIFPGFKQ